jgi:prepilin-type N-terminal cleavage/methylation domain-containing protein
MTAAPLSAPGRKGFTLLEVLAVLLIASILMYFMVPNMSILQNRELPAQAKRVAAKIDLGRQRAVMTRIPHRIFIDLDAGTYGLEWEGSGEVTETASDVLDPSAPLSLEPPPLREHVFGPLPGLGGHIEDLGKEIAFVRIETEGGSVRNGEAFVHFERDGTASPAKIVLDDSEGRQLSLEILTLADSVRILDETR